MKLLVALEARLAAAPDGTISSPTGIEGPAFWERYLDVFDSVTVAARTTPPREGDAARRPPIEGPRVSVAPLPDYRGLRGWLQARSKVRATLRRAVADADALCLRAPGPIAAAAWRLRGRRPFAVEVVGDPHAALAPGAVRGLARPLARHRLTRELRAMCRSAAAVAYVTSAGLPERYPAADWWTSYSSLDLEDDAFIDEATLASRAAWRARPSRGTAIDPWRMVAVGSLAQPYKGYDVLIDALARLRTRGLVTDLTLVGEGRLRAALAARAARAGVALRLPGHVPAGPAVRAHLDAADVFVLPSRSEGLPRALLEAMARGVPSVGTEVGGVPALLPGERLAPPGDADALAARLARLASRSTDPLAWGVRDRATAYEHHVRTLAPKRAALYQRLHDAAVAGPA
ncbi:MAG: glycosyltransferase family 4 protein [Deltaproteobacteria bacterium]|nr:glycosyltransferase family 4 protein [Deltaproteobacteria bacterium]